MTLNPSTAAQAYQYNGVAGQRLSFNSLSATVNQANWRLLGPANQVVAGAANITADLPDVVLPVTGNYVLLVEGTPMRLLRCSFSSRPPNIATLPSRFQDLASFE